MANTQRPNFLFITTDQQRWDAMGHNNPHIRTPAMDALARDGLRFDRAYPTNAICMPARASMITGRSQRGHQVFDHAVNLSESIPVMGDSLRTAGYATSLIGKAHFKTADLEDVLPDQPPPGAPVSDEDGLWYGPYFGFDYAEIHTGHAYPAGHWRVWLERNHPDGLRLWRQDQALEEPSGAFSSWKNSIPAEWHYTHWTADRTIAWLRQRDPDQPFFLWMSFADPHQPFAPPRPYCDMYDPAAMPGPVPREDVSRKPPAYQWARDGMPYGGYNTHAGWSGDHFGEIVAHYYGLTTFIDDEMARVLEELDQMGLRDSTHVVFTSDHGEGLSDHGVAAKPMMSYEAVNRVPWLWRHPPTVDAGRQHDSVMTHLDFVPTVLDLAGADPLLGMEGRSFAPLLRGESDTHRDAVIVERITILGGGGGARLLDAKVGKNLRAANSWTRDHDRPFELRVKMLVTDRWKLLHYGGQPHGELYDVVNDPEDIHNLWDDPEHADVRRELTDRLLAELIDSELGDAVAIRQAQALGGALRDQRLLEGQPEARASLGERTRGM